MNKKTVSWAVSVMMAGSLAAAPFAGAQTTGGQQGLPAGQAGMMMGSGMGQQMGGPMGMMGGEDRGMFDLEDMGIDIDQVVMKAASKNALPPVCQPQAADIKAQDLDAIDDCIEALEGAVEELVDQNQKMTGQQISDATGIGKMFKSGGVSSSAKRVGLMARIKTEALEARDAVDMAETMEKEHEANIAQRQEMRKQEASMRQNMMGQMGSGQMPSGMGMTQPGMGMNGMAANGLGVNGLSANGMGMNGPMGQGGMMPGATNGSMGTKPSSMMGGFPGMPKTADEAARMYEQTNPGKTYTPEMRAQFNSMQANGGSFVPGSFGGSAQGGMVQPGMGSPMNGQQGMMQGGMMGGQMGQPMMGQPGQNNQGGMMPPMNGMQPSPMGGSMGMQPPMMSGGMPPPGGAPSGQPMPPPGGSTPPPPPPPTASAIGTLGMGFWRGFFNFLGF